MKRFLLKSLLAPGALVTICASTLAQLADPIRGPIRSSSGNGWQASWIELQQPTSFKKGDKVALALQGSAKSVLVRFLPSGASADSPTGVEGSIRQIPPDRVLVVVLERDHDVVTQISVHAGPSAWGIKLGETNGTVAIVGVTRTQ
jgi:hypothetical protein